MLMKQIHPNYMNYETCDPMRKVSCIEKYCNEIKRLKETNWFLLSQSNGMWIFFTTIQKKEKLYVGNGNMWLYSTHLTLSLKYLLYILIFYPVYITWLLMSILTICVYTIVESCTTLNRKSYKEIKTKKKRKLPKQK